MILYYGYDCPHCKLVEQFISENNLTEKFGIAQLEIKNNTFNMIKFQKAAQKCNISEKNFGVPMLVADGVCYQGDIDSINFLRNKMNSG